MSGRHAGSRWWAPVLAAWVACAVLACGGKGHGTDPGVPEDPDVAEEPDALAAGDGEGTPDATAAPDTLPDVPSPLQESAQCFPDADGDGFPANGAGVSRTADGACPAGTAPIRTLAGRDLLDCDDGDAAVNPASAEACNGRDDDCDGAVDDVLPRECFAGCTGYPSACRQGAWQDCGPLPACCEGQIKDAVTCLPGDYLLLIDVSSGMAAADPSGLRFTGARRFVQRMSGDQARVATFHQALVTWGPFTSSVAEAEGWLALAQLSPAAGLLDLDTALLAAMDLFPEQGRRRVLVLATAGTDGVGAWNAHAVRLKAVARNVRLLVVGLGKGVDASALTGLVERPGDLRLVEAPAGLEAAFTGLFSQVSASDWQECHGGAWEVRTGACGKPSRDCVVQVCDGDGNCTLDPGPREGLPCDDQNRCTVHETCRSGECVGAEPLCRDDDPCTADVCDPETGACRFDRLPAGTACPDDGNPCTRDFCDAAGTCFHPPAFLNTECPGSTPCIRAHCNGKGVCVFDAAIQKGLPCADDGNACTEDVCDGIEGICVHDGAKLEGKSCEDGDFCSKGDTCRKGACVPAAFTECGDVCLHCEPATGLCVAYSDGLPCADGDQCTSDDRCLSGKCVGQMKDCDDRNPCTADWCLPGNGSCAHDGAPLDGTPCDDGFKCTNPDACQGGACVGQSMTCPTYGDVKPIFQAKCAGCHGGTGGCSTGKCFADTYPGPGTASMACPFRTLDQCIAIRTRAGDMPPNQVCTGNPDLDAGKPQCLAATELLQLDDWAAGGGQP